MRELGGTFKGVYINPGDNQLLIIEKREFRRLKLGYPAHERQLSPELKVPVLQSGGTR